MYEHAVGSINQKKRLKKILFSLLIIILVAVVGYFGYQNFFKAKTIQEKIEYRMTFDSSVTEAEQTKISDQIVKNNVQIEQDYAVKAVMIGTNAESNDKIVDAYVPVAKFGAVRQKLMADELTTLKIFMPVNTPEQIVTALSEKLGVTIIARDISDLSVDEIAFIPASGLNSDYKLLEYEGEYYLDTLGKGAEFRSIVFEGDDKSVFSELNLNELNSKDEIYKVNMTGVTALTRIMQRKLTEVGDPLYFSRFIGDFLADADLTHVSNEVSFLEDCSISYTSFCSPPEFIETLKASGVDLVEITGNHNNDRGAEANKATIELYRILGWETVGGGLDSEDAKKPVLKDVKGTKLAFLAYNYPDSPNGGAISSETRAGANSFNFTKIENDIASAKETSDFVIVNVQFWECYAYPDGYIEFPQCDGPIGDQEETFKKIIDLGADMVVGSSAHQPQIYELYKGKPIYYGLGNLYFDQTQWPGTERGIILTHYFVGGLLVQTKLTPTVFDADLQTRVMTDNEAEYLLQRLYNAR